MIYGIGTDVVAVARMQIALERHGERFAEKILAESELLGFGKATDAARFLAKRFAAKESLAKALGTGLRSPVTLSAMAVEHDELGKPYFIFADALAALIAQKRLRSHLSISDEKDYVVAFALLEIE